MTYLIGYTSSDIINHGELAFFSLCQPRNGIRILANYWSSPCDWVELLREPACENQILSVVHSYLVNVTDGLSTADTPVNVCDEW